VYKCVLPPGDNPIAVNKCHIIKKTDIFLQKGMKTKKTVTLQTKMLVIRKMEAGEKPAYLA